MAVLYSSFSSHIRRTRSSGIGVAFSRRHLLAGALLAAPIVASCGLTERDGAGKGHETQPKAAAALPGRILYVADSDIWVWERGQSRRLTNDRVSRQPVWSPDGKRIAHIKIHTSSSELWVMDTDGANSRMLTHNFSTILQKNNWAFRPAWWPDSSRLLYLSDETTKDLMVWQMDPQSKQRRLFVSVPDGEGGLDMPSISPDGKRLLAISYRTASVKPQVFTFGLPSGPWRQLTEHPEGVYDPVWSPDGTKIAYTARERGRHDLWVMNADGSQQQQLTDSGTCRAPCWSPDGQHVAFISASAGTFDIWQVPMPTPAAAAAPPASAAPRQGANAGAGVADAAPKFVPAPVTRGLSIDPLSGLSWSR